jgi:hypothetical protein
VVGRKGFRALVGLGRNPFRVPAGFWEFQKKLGSDLLDLRVLTPSPPPVPFYREFIPPAPGIETRYLLPVSER